ncbi:MAG: DUF2294 domain-containing protein [Phycisphaerae bacterium]|nr:DUF2294 domain-containing protein [Phycisphaerae bacterium]
MDDGTTGKARQIARVAEEFEKQRTGHGPRSVTVVLTGDLLVVALHGALSPAEQALARDPEGSAQFHEFHRQLFASAAGVLRKEIERVIGVEVREASAEFEPATGALVKVFTTGTVVQLFLLAGTVETDAWSTDSSAREVGGPPWSHGIRNGSERSDV